MNITTAKTRFTSALIAVIAMATFVVGHASTAPQDEIVQLERVVIVGKRIQQLPRVVVEGRRAPADTVVAQACAVDAHC